MAVAFSITGMLAYDLKFDHITGLCPISKAYYALNIDNECNH